MASSETYTLGDSRLKKALDALEHELQRLNTGYQALQAAYEKHRKRDLLADGAATAELLNMLYGPVLACREYAPLQSAYQLFENVNSEIQSVQSTLVGLRERKAQRLQAEAERQAHEAQLEAAEHAEYTRIEGLHARFGGSKVG
jgi:hypothetical protein